MSFQVESSGTNFFAQCILPNEVVLLHQHPLELFDEIFHGPHFRCKCVVLMHFRPGYCPYRGLIRGGHFDSLCLNISRVGVIYKASCLALAFEGYLNCKAMSLK